MTFERLSSGRGETVSRKIRADLPDAPWAWSASDPPKKGASRASAVHYTTTELQQHRNRRWAKPWLASVAPPEHFATKLLEAALSDARPMLGSLLRGKGMVEGKAAIRTMLEDKGALDALVDIVWDGAQPLLYEQAEPAAESVVSVRIAASSPTRERLFDLVGVPPPQPFNGSFVPRPYLLMSGARSPNLSKAARMGLKGGSNALKQKLMPGHLGKFKNLFGEWDEDKSGAVDKFEFRSAVRALGIVASDAECDATFVELDFNRDGTISYDEYIRYALRDLLARSFGRVIDLFRKM